MPIGRLYVKKIIRTHILNNVSIFNFLLPYHKKKQNRNYLYIYIHCLYQAQMTRDEFYVIGGSAWLTHYNEHFLAQQCKHEIKRNFEEKNVEIVFKRSFLKAIILLYLLSQITHECVIVFSLHSCVQKHIPENS